MPTRTEFAELLFTVSDVLSAEECERLVARGEAVGFEPATVARRDGARRMTEVRDNDRVTFEDAGVVALLWERLRPQLPDCIEDSVPAGLNPRLRIYRYEAAQRFNGHRDGSVELGPGERTRLSLLVYLNDVAAGGATTFFAEERVGGARRRVAEVMPAPGTALVFAHGWWHEGARVVEGRKYVLRSDVVYRSRSG